MEVLQPSEPKADEATKEYNTIFASEKINPKNVEFLSFLGLKDSMFDSKIMDKISYLSDKIELNDLEKLSLKFGTDGSMSKLDKILIWVKLSDQEKDYKQKLDLISNSKGKL